MLECANITLAEEFLVSQRIFLDHTPLERRRRDTFPRCGIKIVNTPTHGIEAPPTPLCK